MLNVIRKRDLKKYPNLHLRGEIIIGKDYHSGIPEVNIRFNNYLPAVVRLNFR